MDIDEQADFLVAAFDAWYRVNAASDDPGRRVVALAAFAAGILAMVSLLRQMDLPAKAE